MTKKKNSSQKTENEQPFTRQKMASDEFVKILKDEAHNEHYRRGEIDEFGRFETFNNGSAYQILLNIKKLILPLF